MAGSVDFPRLSTQRREFLNEAAARYATALTSETTASEYLASRGFDQQTIQTFQLGYVAECLPGHEKARGFLSIPYRSPSGVTQIRFRRVGDDGNKWWTEGGIKDPLFNVIDLHRPEEYVAICEGHTDTITMSGLVGVPTVGIAGAGKWEKHWSRCFSDYGTVFLVLDPDPAGEKGTARLVERLEDAGCDTKVITLPGDVNSTYLMNGSEFIRKAMGL